MNTKFMLSLALVAAFGLSACKSVEVDSNGTIANEYISALNEFEGSFGGTLLITYSGSEQRASQTVTKNFKLNLNSIGNRPVLKSNTDILGAGCGSRIGKLLALEVGGAWDYIAKFEFSPGACADRANGKYVLLYGKKNRALFTLKKDHYQSQGPGHLGSVSVEYRSNIKRL